MNPLIIFSNQPTNPVFDDTIIKAVTEHIFFTTKINYN